MRTTSRRLLAKTFVDELARAKSSSDKARLKQSLAAYLIETKQQKHADMLLGDIGKELAARGHVVAETTTAAELTEVQRQAITDTVKDTTGAKTVELFERVEPSIIGGIRLSLPGSELDATIKRRLQSLQFNED